MIVSVGTSILHPQYTASWKRISSIELAFQLRGPSLPQSPGDFAPVCPKAPGAKVRQESTRKEKTGNWIFDVMLPFDIPKAAFRCDRILNRTAGYEVWFWRILFVHVEPDKSS
jgi:hypothetical protein